MTHIPPLQKAAPASHGDAPSTADTLLAVEGLTTHFFTEEGAVHAVDNVSFSLKRGETLGVVGESGCGKSVTALSIMRLIAEPGRIIAGRLLFDDTDLRSLGAEEMRQVRGNRISMIFQQPTTSLNPVFKVGDQIIEVLKIHRAMGAQAARDHCVKLFSMVGLPDPTRRLHNYPHELSGGQCQRVMIAMALACEPELLIADEPTTALDVTIQAQILDLMRSLREQINTSIMLITHDMGVVAEMADRVVVMYAGQVVEEAAVLRLFREPKHPYTQGLLASIPVLGHLQEELAVIPGVVPNLTNPAHGCRFANRCPHRFERCDDDPPLFVPEEGRQVRCWLHAEGNANSTKQQPGSNKP
jgi:peptide/nickel transport system ATP-binding protein